MSVERKAKGPKPRAAPRREVTGELEVRLGKVIAAERRRAKLSQVQLAERSGVHVQYVSQLERGLKSPTVRILTDIARALKTEAHVLLRKMITEPEESVDEV